MYAGLRSFKNDMYCTMYIKVLTARKWVSLEAVSKYLYFYSTRCFNLLSKDVI